MKFLDIRTISKLEFFARLSFGRQEDLKIIKQCEDYLLEKRHYILRLPKKGDAVILLLSGGIDSVVLWGALLEKGITVYPVHAENKWRWFSGQWRSIQYFSRFFLKKYSNNYKPIRYFVDRKFGMSNVDQFQVDRHLSPEQIMKIAIADRVYFFKKSIILILYKMN